MKIFYFFLGMLLFLGSSAYSDVHHPQEFLKSIVGSEQEGEKIVSHFCANCHAMKPLIPLGAPRIGQRNDWLPRIKTGAKTMFTHLIEGFNAMPARGGCFECTDEQLELAILAMLPEEAKKDINNDLKEFNKNK